MSLFAIGQALTKRTIALPFVTGGDRLKLIATPMLHHCQERARCPFHKE
ncbi:hypothetical protein [Microcoleus sp. OTE_8_concoct_300]